MTFVVVSPAGEQRVIGRRKLFECLDAMGEDERAAVVVRSGHHEDRGDRIFARLDPKVWGGMRPVLFERRNDGRRRV